MTHNNKVHWNTGPDRWTFLLSLPEGSIQIRDSGAAPDTEFTFTILNRSGEEVESFIRRTTSEETAALRALWNLAKDNALKITETLNGIESRLERLDS